MSRLDEDRTKLYDDTHAALANFELRVSEINAILKARQDNAEKYVGDMKSLLDFKTDFERQAKLLNDKTDRMHDKFTHRETIVSREIKLLKNKFDMLEKNRQFRALLHKSNALQPTSGSTDATGADISLTDDLMSNSSINNPNSNSITSHAMFGSLNSANATGANGTGKPNKNSTFLRLTMSRLACRARNWLTGLLPGHNNVSTAGATKIRARKWRSGSKVGVATPYQEQTSSSPPKESVARSSCITLGDDVSKSEKTETSAAVVNTTSAGLVNENMT